MNVLVAMTRAACDPEHGFAVGAHRRLTELVRLEITSAIDFRRNVTRTAHEGRLVYPEYWSNPHKPGTEDYNSWENQYKSGRDWIDQELDAANA